MADSSTPLFSVHEGQLIASVTCDCMLGARPMLILGTDAMALCPFCQAGYAVIEARYDRQTHEGLAIRVGRVENARMKTETGHQDQSLIRPAQR